jgi:hypothetical protein
MDIYRFFHPHHNPRLNRTKLRQQELSELEQSASELRKALERAQQRAEKKPVAPIMPEHFTDLIKAVKFIEASLQTLVDVHPGDTEQDLTDLINERSGFSGWENWTSLLSEHLDSTHLDSAASFEDSPDKQHFEKMRKAS